MKTYSAKASECVAKWYLIDAENVTLGRLAAYVSMVLRGKHKPMYTPSMDCGDHVVIINADKIALSGNKRTQKTYYRHTGHPGGIKGVTADKVLDGQFPERVMEKAVERMIDRGPLGRQQMKKLHVYAGTAHKHEAQKPEVIDFASMNTKNVRGAE